MPAKRKVVDKYEVFLIGTSKVLHLRKLKSNLEKELEDVIKKLEILTEQMHNIIED